MTLQQTYDEHLLIRHKWSDTDEDGRQLLCLYTALAGDPEARPETCPANLCPRWFAHLLPWIDDAGSEEAWPRHVARVVAVADRLAHLSPECEWRVRALCVREAMRHTEDPEVLAVCRRVAVLCERRGRGEVVADKEFEAAAEAAAEAAEAEKVVAAAALGTAAIAAGRTEMTNNAAAASAAGALATATWIAEIAEIECVSAASASAIASASAMMDQLITTILDEVEHDEERSR